jgi:hypothetical protein
MTKLLKRALELAAQLPEAEQDALAAILLEELAAEERWAKLFADTADELAALANEALAEHRRGETVELNLPRRK